MAAMKAKLKPPSGLNARKIQRKVQTALFRWLGHAGAAIRLTARRSIRRSKTPSAPGSAPHTRRGQLKRAVVYAVEKDKDRVLIGPDHGVVGPSAMAHEHGGTYRGEQYDRRPLMGPALEKNRHRLPKFWAGSVK